MPTDPKRATTREEMAQALRESRSRFGEEINGLANTFDDLLTLASRLPSPAPCREAHEAIEATDAALARVENYLRRQRALVSLATARLDLKRLRERSVRGFDAAEWNRIATRGDAAAADYFAAGGKLEDRE